LGSTQFQPITLTGLTDGLSYTVSMAAANTHGASPSSNEVMVRPHDAPPDPVPTISVRSGDQTTTPPMHNPRDPALTVTWTAPADAGRSPITGYTVTVQINTGYGYGTVAETSTGSPQLSCVVRGLRPGLYRVTVQAQNSAGTSTPAYPPTDQWNTSAA
jgi:hypothetical protein